MSLIHKVPTMDGGNSHIRKSKAINKELSTLERQLFFYSEVLEIEQLCSIHEI